MRSVIICRISDFLFPQEFQILFPLNGQQIFLLVITLFAYRDQVSFSGFPSPDDRDDMVHGQVLWVDLLSTVMTHSGSTFPFPPLRVP